MLHVRNWHPSMNGVYPAFLLAVIHWKLVLQTTLECLYDVVCIDRLKAMYVKINFTICPLDLTFSVPKAAVQYLVSKLLINRWENNVCYERYYTACEPLSCSYSITKQTNLLYIISTIISLFSGLSIVLKQVIPVAVNIGLHGIRRHR